MSQIAKFKNNWIFKQYKNFYHQLHQQVKYKKKTNYKWWDQQCDLIKTIRIINYKRIKYSIITI